MFGQDWMLSRVVGLFALRGASPAAGRWLGVNLVLTENNQVSLLGQIVTFPVRGSTTCNASRLFR